MSTDNDTNKPEIDKRQALRTKREDYRILSNGGKFIIQGRFRFLFWKYWRTVEYAMTEVPAEFDSLEEAESQIRKQIAEEIAYRTPYRPI